MDWTDFKKTFTQEQEDALWQYFMDHSQVQPNGYYGIMFYIEDINDFWKRVHARYSGDFIRYDIQEKQFKKEKYAALKSQAIKGRKWDEYDVLIKKSWHGFLWNLQKNYAKNKLKK